MRKEIWSTTPTLSGPGVPMESHWCSADVLGKDRVPQCQQGLWDHSTAPKGLQGALSKCREGSTKLTANIWKWEYRKIIDRVPYYIIDF